MPALGWVAGATTVQSGSLPFAGKGHSAHSHRHMHDHRSYWARATGLLAVGSAPLVVGEREREGDKIFPQQGHYKLQCVLCPSRHCWPWPSLLCTHAECACVMVQAGRLAPTSARAFPRLSKTRAPLVSAEDAGAAQQPQAPLSPSRHSEPGVQVFQRGAGQAAQGGSGAHEEEQAVAGRA